MQDIVCAIINCGFHSPSGFCLNRLVSINEQGMCNYLTKPGWNQEVSKQRKSNFKWWQQEKKRQGDAAAAITSADSETNEEQDPDKIQKGRAPA